MSTKKHALLIGINNYTRLGNLGFAANDAKAVAQVLRDRYRFADDEIVLMTCDRPGIYSPTQNNIDEQLLRLRKLGSLGLLLVGFWGHGTVDSQQHRYLCAQDSSDADDERLKKTGISHDVLMGYLQQAAVPNTCVILDCCQSRTIGRVSAPSLTHKDSENLSRGARDVVAACRNAASPSRNPTMIILNSCSITQRAFEWEDRKHGIFTAHLLDAMASQKSVMQWANHVSEHVPKTASLFGHNQKPFVTLEGGGDIVFELGEPTNAPVVPVYSPQPPPVRSVDDEAEAIYQRLKADKEAKERKVEAERLARERIERERQEELARKAEAERRRQEEAEQRRQEEAKRLARKKLWSTVSPICAVIVTVTGIVIGGVIGGVIDAVIDAGIGISICGGICGGIGVVIGGVIGISIGTSMVTSDDIGRDIGAGIGVVIDVVIGGGIGEGIGVVIGGGIGEGIGRRIGE